MKLAFVTPWYGENIPGGAEIALRNIIKHLRVYNIEIEVITTCVKQFSSDWNKNFYRQKRYYENETVVNRFKVKKRNKRKFDEINYKLMNNVKITTEEEQIYINESINSPNLCEYIKNNINNYDLFIFTPYLFGIIYNGIKECLNKAVLIPCFHNESYIYLTIYRKLFCKVKAISFNSQPEYDMIKKLYDLKKVKTALIGIGINNSIFYNEDIIKKKFHINDSYILYAGRKDKNKNIYELLEYFKRYKLENKNSIRLVLIGGGDVFIPPEIKNDVYDLGFVSEEEKHNIYANSMVCCQPSINESFSLVIMESWICKKPVLVNSKCEVTKNFACKANGGLYYNNYYEFEECLNYIISNPKIMDRIAMQGNSFVIRNFDWNVITKKYISFFESLIGGDSLFAIEVKNLKKEFNVYFDKSNSLKEKVLFRSRNYHEKRVVLNDISFNIKKGEAIGFIGKNGCGKSTLLKILTRIIYPSSGTINIKGKVSSLIELGAGFHPDMTGRENIYINASIFGLKKKEIDMKIDSIINFSELEQFIDNPVRTYSSGMYMRLAFSIAINVDAEILLIDEILAVGDIKFQEKCFNKLVELKNKGTTIVIVSHSLSQIEEICDRSIWIKDGLIKMNDKPSIVHPKYLECMGIVDNENYIKHDFLKSIELDKNKYEIKSNINIKIGFMKKIDLKDIIVGIKIFNEKKILCSEVKIDKYKKTNNSTELVLENIPFTNGKYLIDIYALKSNKTMDYISNACYFEIINKNNNDGIVLLDYKLK